MVLTEQERAEVMRRVLQDDHVQAFERLRAAAHTWLHWPLSRKRLNAVIDAYIDVQMIQINRATGTAGALVAVLDERLFTVEQTLAQHSDRLRRLEERINANGQR